MLIKKALILMFLICCLFNEHNSSVFGDEINVLEYKPKWNVGDEWIIKNVFQNSAIAIPVKPNINTEEYLSNLNEDRRTEYISFQVIGIENIDGEECFVIKRIRTDAKGQEKLQTPNMPIYELWYFRKENFSLKRIIPYQKEGLPYKRSDVVKVKKKERPKNSSDLYEKEYGQPYVDKRDYVEGPLIVNEAISFPFFSIIGISNQEENMDILEYPEYLAKQELKSEDTIVSDQSEQNVLVVTLQDRSQPNRKCVQKWIKGKPWWSEAEFWSEGNLRVHSYLINKG